MVRILYISSFGQLRGGGQISLLNLLRGLDKKRFSPVLLCPERGDLGEAASALGIPVEVIKIPSFKSLNLPRIIQVWHKLCRLVRKYEIQIIHTEGLRETFYAALLCFFYPIRLVWHVRVAWRSWLRDRILFYLSDQIICVAQATAERFKGCLGSKKKIEIIYNGVDLEEFNPQRRYLGIKKRYDIPEDCRVVGTIGRLDPDKRAEDLIRSIPSVQETFPKTRFVIVGDDNRGYYQKLKQLAEDLKIVSQVVFTGALKDVQGLLSVFDLFVLPTINKEGISRAILEAMALAKPVIATKVGGNPETVEDKITGILIPAKKPELLAQTIISLLKDRERAEEMGQAGRRRVEKLFSLKTNVARTEKVYLNLIRR